MLLFTNICPNPVHSGNWSLFFFLGRGTLTVCQRRRIFPQWWAVNQLLLEAEEEARDVDGVPPAPSPRNHTRPTARPPSAPPIHPFSHPSLTRTSSAPPPSVLSLHLRLLWPNFLTSSSALAFSLLFLPLAPHLPHHLCLPLHPHFTPPAGSHPWRTLKRRSSLSQHRFTFPSRSGRTTGMKDWWFGGFSPLPTDGAARGWTSSSRETEPRIVIDGCWWGVQSTDATKCVSTFGLITLITYTVLIVSHHMFCFVLFHVYWQTNVSFELHRV